jgi:hypothetical protein
MPIKRVIGLYLGILLPILALFIFTAIFSVYAPTAVPQLSAAIPVFMDLIKVIVGGAIGAFSVVIGNKAQ